MTTYEAVFICFLLDFDDFCCGQCFFHQLVDLLVQFLLGSADHFEVWFCYRMFCNKIVQQSSNGWIEVSNVLIFLEI